MKQPKDSTHMQRAGQRPEGNDPQTQYRNDQMAGTWSPSGLHDGPAGEEQILGAIFDRLAEAAAAHDDETAAEGIEEIKAGLAAPHGGPGQRPGTS